MALVFTDGFDAGDYATKWTVNPGNVVTTSTSTRYSVGRSMYLGGSYAYIYKIFPAVSQIFVGFAFYASSGNLNTFLGLVGDSGTLQHLTLRYSTPTTLTLARGGTDIASATHTIPTTWNNYYEISATIADAGGTCVVKVNGVTLINYTGDTKNGGTNNSIDRITLGLQVPTNDVMLYDDLYICDGTGSAPNNTFLGDVRIHTLVPNAAGSVTQMTPSSGANYTTVDELPYSATDYVRGSQGQADLYSTTDLPAGVGTIYGVQANAIVKKTDAGNLSGRTKIKSGTTTANGTSIALGTSDATISDIRQLNPDTSTAWTTGDVNSIEVGVEAV